MQAYMNAGGQWKKGTWSWSMRVTNGSRHMQRLAPESANGVAYENALGWTQTLMCLQSV